MRRAGDFRLISYVEITMSRLISATLGRFSPRFRTLDAFLPIYRQTLAARGLAEKTLQNHDVALRHRITSYNACYTKLLRRLDDGSD